ncbi:oligosaccharide flippase family protein [Candidatus Sumerlaeota bacterium]|nr:oligosaccharide flippase family protein [Candidatus Sumerlaeota bacterium]
MKDAFKPPLSNNSPRKTKLHGIGSLITSGFFSHGMGAMRLLIFAPLLGPAHFGALRLAMTASLILSSLAGLGLHTSYLRYLPELKPAETPGFIRKTLTWAFVPCCFAALIIVIVSKEFSRFLFSNSEMTFLTILVAVSLPVTMLYKSFYGITSGIGRFRNAGAGDALQNGFFFLVGILALFLVSRTSDYAFIGYLAGYGMGVFWFYSKIVHPLLKKGDSIQSVDKTVFSRALQFSIWYSLIPLFHYLFNFIDRWMLAHFYNLETTGTYSLVPLFASGMFVAGSALSTITARKAAELRGRDLFHASERLIWGALCLSVLASLLYSFFMRLFEPVIWKIAGLRWQAALPLLPLFLVYSTFYNIFYQIGCFASLEEKTWVHLVSAMAGTFVNALINLTLVKPYGIYGVATGTLLGMLVSIMVYFAFVYSRKIAVLPRVWMAMIVSFSIFLPRWIFLAMTLVIFLAAYKTNLILNDSDRRMARAWIAGAIREWKIKRQA